MYDTIIDCASLRRHLGDPAWAVVDCRYELGRPRAGELAYRQAHVPGARYAHLERDLSGPPLTDHGRHPLPSPAALTDLFGRLGVGPGVQVVVYDASGGTMAARLWWLLRYMAHAAAAVLDGGWPAWLEAGGPVEAGSVTPASSTFTGAPQPGWLVTVDQVAAAPLLVDARDPARYRGEHEPLDPVAGHIPGARNRYCGENLDERGRLRPPAALREAFAALLGGTPADAAVFYCGSGVTACHDLLALAHAGLGAARLYAGSWSEWCRDPARPVAIGPEPDGARRRVPGAASDVQ